MTPEAIAGSPIRQAIANASQATGMDFGFLLSTAVRESALNPRAEARTSSATGLFQFLDQTWLATVKRHGAKHGLAGEAALITMGPDGRASVADPAMRRVILDMRYDPELSARMAAEFAADNADHLRARTGGEPRPGDLYAAHFLGAAGAAELLNAARDTPWARADALFPAAAAANRPIFHDADGRARTVVEVLDNLRRTAEREPPPVSQREMGARPVTLFRVADTGEAAQGFDPNWPERSALAMLNGGEGVGGFGQDRRDGFTIDPATLAQMYGASDQMRDAAAMQAVGAMLSTGSIAQALSPENGRSDRAKTGLRGRS